MVWFGLALASPLPCGLFGPAPSRPHPLLPRAAGTLQVRDAHVAHLNLRETPHFAIKWIDAGDPDPRHLDLLEADLERVWHGQIEQLGWRPPEGSEAYKLNVYLGYEGTDAPSIDFGGGYVWSDDEGFPYIVISPSSLDLYDIDSEERTLDLLAHEFHHTLQARDWERFTDTDTAFFWWEATASWAVPYVLSDPSRANYWGVLLHPHVGLTTFSQDWEDAERGGHQYEAAAFAWHLSEHHGVELIRESWEDPTALASPLEWLGTRIDVDEAYRAFALDMALERHPRAEAWSQELRGDPAHQVTLRLPRLGTDGWIAMQSDQLPEAYAWNRVDWAGGEAGTLELDFRTPSAALAAWLAVDGEVTPLTGPKKVEVTEDSDVRIVVIATPAQVRPDRRFAYEVRAELETVEPVQARGCDVANAGAGTWASLLRRR